ncbi:MAG: Required for respiratory growth protein 9 mitochondrial [Pleopsidium flavum]|nr:MAG: Required for respiratory growth protein 9 mitochondrial [Pleopsidium flavum]
MEPLRTERLDDLYIPFEKLSARNETTVSRPLDHSTSGIAPTWGSTDPPAILTISGHQMFRRSEAGGEEDLKRFEPDVELRNKSYIFEGGSGPAASQVLLEVDDTENAGLRIRGLLARSPSTSSNQASAAMDRIHQDRDKVRQAFPGGQATTTGSSSFQALKSRVRRRRKESEQLLNMRSYKETPTSKQSNTLSHKSPVPRKREPWQVQKLALIEKFGRQGWSPRKRLSPDALEGIRALHAQYPDKFTTPVLADQFKVSPEAIRRILRSKWRPDAAEEVSRLQRWDKRGELIWGQMVEIGIKPPKRWREMGIVKKEDRLHSELKPKGRQGSDWLTGSRNYKVERSTSPAVVKGERDEESLAERIL